ncbi:MAG: cation diffusion facilitator family transporter [Desulfomicrobium escambiense]|nr:cation diffusion facilitator family transporter [Desulfomicrobium escambiense]
MILVAAATIMYAAIDRFLHPSPLTGLGPGLVNRPRGLHHQLWRFAFHASHRQRHDSITLEADARHLMTDVWTSVGVVAALGVVLIAPPDWSILDPVIAVIVGLNIICTGVNLIRRSMAGLMDSSLPAAEVTQIEDAIRAKKNRAEIFHGLRDAQVRFATLRGISSAGAWRPQRPCQSQSMQDDRGGDPLAGCPIQW